MPEHTDFLLIGGGIIGLGIADALANSGATVTVLEAGKPGQASRAAAGMLAPLAEGSMAGPFVELGIQSLYSYPNWIAQISEGDALTIEIAGPGMIRGARTIAERDALLQAFAWQSQTNLPLSWLERDELLALEPALSPNFQCATLSPEEKHVNPRTLMEVLTAKCQRSHVTILDAQTVLSVETSQGHVTGVNTSDNHYSAGQIVITSGAWSSGIARLFRNLSFPVGPVRGQVISLGPITPNTLRHTIYTHGCYVVPRTDGRIVIGATEEPNAEFNTDTTPSGIEMLRRGAAGMVPMLSEIALESAWTGLRPVCADGMPILGQLPGWHNAHVATGHGRNGILLAPITAKVMSDYLLHGTPVPAPFAVSRFTESLCAHIPR